MSLPYDSDHNVGIRLDSEVSCRQELERTSNGLAQLTQEATRNREALSVIEEQLELVEAIVAKAIRENTDAKLTAAEVKGRMTELIAEEPHFAGIREQAHSLRAEADTLERRLRTLEKRASAAQSTLRQHENEARHGGFGQ